ncbi:MAG: CDP-glycerol glycerophosphotransferase family protein [Methanobacteriaceae archaeon]|jgi:CDP-ribitol ribitolphosphotransferase|nr:CDP-glycerol glycerophosphotransferase family protein [Methanobacteriaceae archaeon]
MYLKHKLFALLFNFFNLFPLKNNYVSFIGDSNNSFNSNFKFIKKEFDNHGNFHYNFFYKDKFSIKSLYEIASSKYIFLNDNFFPLAFMNFKKGVKVSQLWHGTGAFKKFGASVVEDKEELAIIEKASNNTDYLFVSSDNVKKFYKKAFLISKSKIKSLGVPRTDYFFDKDLDINELKNNFYKKYPESKNKKIVLYAPTFRDTEKYNDVFKFFDLNQFNELFSNEYIFTLRLHPKIKNFISKDLFKENNFIDLSDYENEMELLLIADILITDYSSIMVEFSILNKPIMFFTYDLEYYLDKDRGFYFDFEKLAPGTISKDFNQLIDNFKNIDFNNINNKNFLIYQFNDLDGKASERIVDFLMNNK